MILVTGAGGKTGRAIIAALARRGEPLRALLHRPEQSETITALGAAETIVGDLRDETVVRAALRGVKAVYHICPNVHPEEGVIGDLVIDAARAAGAKHFVYHSVLHPQTLKMPHHWNKLRVEERLFESGLPFTILQPTAYMQNLLTGWPRIVEEGVYHVPYPVETRLSLVDVEDVAEAAAIVLTEPGHVNAIYELVGTPPLTQGEVAEVLSQVLNRHMRAEAIPIERWKRTAHESGLSANAIETLIKMFLYYAQYGLAGNPNVLSWLLGRAPTQLAAFIEQTVRQRV